MISSPREPRPADGPSRPIHGRRSSYVEMTLREGDYDLPPPRSATVDFRPLGRHPPPPETASAPDDRAVQRDFSRIALAAAAFAQEQANKGSWLCDMMSLQGSPNPIERSSHGVRGRHRRALWKVHCAAALARRGPTRRWG